MKMIGPYIFFILLANATLCAQKNIQIGSNHFTIPDQSILSRKYQDDYLECRNDTLFYYLVRKGNDSTFSEMSIYAVPFGAIEKKSLSMEKVVTESREGELSTEYRTLVGLDYDFYKKNPVMKYIYYANGKIDKEEEYLIFIYSNSREIYDMLRQFLKI